MPSPSLIAQEMETELETAGSRNGSMPETSSHYVVPIKPYWYLSGPMTGFPDHNSQAFADAAEQLRKEGYIIINPYETNSEKEIRETTVEERYGPAYRAVLAKDIEVVANPACEGVFVLEHWQRSKGAKLEVHVARELGKPIKDAFTKELVAISVGENVLEEAQRLVEGGARDESYGHPYKAFSKAAKIMTAILDHEVKPEEVPLLMIAMKLSRQANHPKRDNLTDIAGYARTAEMMEEYDAISN